MLDIVFGHGVALVLGDLRLSVVFVLGLLLVVTRVTTSARSGLALRSEGREKTPPILPYAVPVLGNVFAFAFDTLGLVNSIVWVSLDESLSYERLLSGASRKEYGSNVPVRMRIVNQQIYYVSGAESVLSMFRGSRHLTTVPSSLLVIENGFGMPSNAMQPLRRDNTGILEQPLPNSNPIEPHNRIWHLTHKQLHRNLAATGLAALAREFVTRLEAELDGLGIGDEWTDVPDLYAVIQSTIFTASTTALCGPKIFALNPDFCKDFWVFDSELPGLFKSLPRWMIPKGFRIRDKMHASIMKWHKWAVENYDWKDEQLAKEEWEPCFGSKLMRERCREYRKIDGYTAEGRAAMDLGMIWG